MSFAVSKAVCYGVGYLVGRTVPITFADGFAHIGGIIVFLALYTVYSAELRLKDKFLLLSLSFLFVDLISFEIIRLSILDNSLGAL